MTLESFFVFLVAIAVLFGLAVFVVWCGLVFIRWVFPTRSQRLADKTIYHSYRTMRIK